MQLDDTLIIAASGLKAENARLRVVAENIANADSTGRSPQELPYRRKEVIFRNVLDRSLGAETVQVSGPVQDTSPFNKKYAPYHPAADAQGYVLMPNVSTIMEMADMRESRRAYEANLNVVDVTRSMLQRTISILQA